MLYCFKCNVADCEHGPCYYCAKGEDNPDPYIQTMLPPDVTGCPQRCDEYDGITPKWKRVPHPIQVETYYDKRYTWLTDGLNDWLNEHWEEVPQFLIDRRQRRKDKRYSLCCLNINCPVQPKTKGAPTIGEAMEKWQQRRVYKDETERQPIGYRR